jgi:Rrf2 family protein
MDVRFAMRMSKKSEYAIHSVVIIAYNRNSPVQLEDMASKQNISKTYLAKVMQELSRSGILKASPGVNGGYTLGKDPSEITVADIFRVFEDTPKSVTCQFNNRGCDAEGICEITKTVSKAFDVMFQELEKTTIADFLKKASVTKYNLVWLKN